MSSKVSKPDWMKSLRRRLPLKAAISLMTGKLATVWLSGGGPILKFTCTLSSHPMLRVRKNAKKCTWCRYRVRRNCPCHAIWNYLLCRFLSFMIILHVMVASLRRFRFTSLGTGLSLWTTMITLLDRTRQVPRTRARRNHLRLPVVMPPPAMKPTYNIGNGQILQVSILPLCLSSTTIVALIISRAAFGCWAYSIFISNVFFCYYSLTFLFISWWLSPTP